MQIVNRKASFDYTFIEKYTAGVVLLGSEVKSIRESKVSMVDAFCYFSNGELILKGLNVTPGLNAFQHEPLREKKLLLKKRELKKMESNIDKGISIIPVRIFLSERGLIKIEIALAKGKKTWDKKESTKERDIKRETDRELGK